MLHFQYEGSAMAKLQYFTSLALVLLTVAPIQVQHSRIQDVDFRNFSYPFKPPPGREPFGKLGDIVKVHDGIAYADKVGQNASFVYFKVAEVLYGDVNGDGQDEAAVVVIYGSNSGTFYLTDIYLFTLRDGKPVLLSRLTEEEIGKDYKGLYNGDGQVIFEALEGGRELKGNILTVRHFADGPHCCPESVVTVRYMWNGEGFSLLDVQKRRSSEGGEKMKAFYETRS
jgi:hypothetical protein